MLKKRVATYRNNPLGFCLFNWMWGENTLKDRALEPWQKEVLWDIGKGLEGGMDVEEAVQLAVASGHGIGKSALIAMIIIWFLSTHAHPQVVVTANTGTQLATKTWRELAKWWGLSLNKDWFTWTATKFYLTDEPATWFASAIPWSKERAEAFAGTHEDNVLVIYDEASGIDPIIWETTEGALT